MTGKDIIKKVENTIKEHGLIAKGDSILIGLSGGADSVFLTVALKELTDKWGVELFAVHVNHNMRGEASDKDEAFAFQLARSMEIPFFSQRLNLKKGARAKEDDLSSQSMPTGSFEADMRDARFIVYKQFAEKFKINKIALAHQEDDLVETILFRFMRGSGIIGLSGIEPQNEVSGIKIIRPILYVSKEEIIEYLKSRDFIWREDKSNFDVSITRNRIRHDLIPYLEKNFNPNLKETILRFARIFSEQRKILEFVDTSYLNKFITSLTDKIIFLEHKKIESLPDYLLAALFRRSVINASRSKYPPEEKFVRRIQDEVAKKKYPLIIRLSASLIVIIKKEGIYFWRTNLKRKTEQREMIRVFNEEVYSN